MATEKRLIYAQEPIRRLSAVCVTDDSIGMGIKMGLDHAIQTINDIPSVDAVEVVHGRWVWKDGCFHCSNCKTSNDHTPAYCEGCGAKMDLKGE